MEVEVEVEGDRRMLALRYGNLWVPHHRLGPAGMVVEVNLADEEGGEAVVVVVVGVGVGVGRDPQQEGHQEGHQETWDREGRRQGQLGSGDLWGEAEVEVLNLVHRLPDVTLQPGFVQLS